MGAFDFIQKWLSPLLDPLNQLRNAFTGPGSPNDIHAQSIGTMLTMLAPLGEQDVFTGDAADAFWAAMQSYLNAENALLPGIAEATVGAASTTGTLTAPTAPAEDIVLDDMTTAAETAAADVGEAGVEAAGQLGDSAGFDEIIGDATVLDAAQGGLDPFTDIPTAALVIVDVGMKIGIVVTLCLAIYNAVQELIHAWNGLVHRLLPVQPPISSQSTPLPQPPAKVYPPGITTQQQKDLYDQFVTGSTSQAYQDAVVAMIIATYSAAAIKGVLFEFTRQSLIFFIVSPTDLNDGTGGPKLTILWLGMGSWNPATQTGNGLQKIIEKHAKNGDLSCWGIGTRKNPAINPQDVINFVQAAVQAIANGEGHRIKADSGNYAFEIPSFKFHNAGGCPLDIIFGPNGDVISIFRPTPQR